MIDQEIFDKDKAHWYRIERGLFGRLRLVKIDYANVTKFPVGNEVAFSASEGLHMMPEPTIPDMYRQLEKEGRI